MIAQLGERRFAAEGSPADCVLAGLYHVMKDAAPDLVLSGVNRGNNAAENTLYSGTIGAAIEAALQGIPAIALSQYFGPDNKDLDDPFEAALVHAPCTLRALLAQGIWQQDADYGIFYNINFPPVPASAVQGTRVVTQGRRKGVNFSVQADTSPTGRDFLWVRGGPQHGATAQGSDAQANLDGFISVTPMRADLTAHDVMNDLKGLET